MSTEQWVDVEPARLAEMLTGQTVVKVEPMIITEHNDLFDVTLTLGNGITLRLEAIAMHGMEACIGVSVLRETSG